MMFFYSRKLQCIFLMLWLMGLLGMYINITGERPLWVLEFGKLFLDEEQKIVLGTSPIIPEPKPEPKPEPEPAPPVLDPAFNHCLEISASIKNASTILFNMDYVPAHQNGFLLTKTKAYYISDEPVFVVDFGDLWQSKADIKAIQDALLQDSRIKNVRFFVTPSNKMRFLLKVSSMNMARNMRIEKKISTEKGLQLEIRIP